jgi:DNA/RNA-binding domain of Phe-tRNA-synthetase-like protein
MNFTLSQRWRECCPTAIMGVLVLHNLTPDDSELKLKALRFELEAKLRSQYHGLDRTALKSLPTIGVYDAFYRRFRKTYHLLLQLESVLGGKSIPAGNPLVSAMFMAELNDLLLTAGHDLDRLSGPIQFDVASGSESYETMSGEPQVLKADDLFTADGLGVISSVIYGPDRRTRILPTTRAALFTTYGVPGITPEQVFDHLGRLRDWIQVFSPDAQVSALEIASGK